MAKYEAHLQGDFHQVLEAVDNAILQGSRSASYEDGSDVHSNGVDFAVRVYERYSMMGGNRVSLTVTLVGKGESLFLSGITAGGSQAMFFKMNTVGESTFLDQLIEAVACFQGA